MHAHAAYQIPIWRQCTRFLYGDSVPDWQIRSASNVSSAEYRIGAIQLFRPCLIYYFWLLANYIIDSGTRPLQQNLFLRTKCEGPPHRVSRILIYLNIYLLWETQLFKRWFCSCSVAPPPWIYHYLCLWVQLWPTLDARRLVWIYYIVFQWNRYLQK